MVNNGQTSTAFVDFQYLQDNSPIYSNLDPEDILWIISPSQDRNITRLTGSALYRKLQTSVDSTGAFTGGTAYKTLIDDYISPALVYFIAADAVEFNAIKFTNKGLVRKTDDNSEPATPEEVQAYKDKILSFAEYYAERIVNHLCANTADFPEYQQNSDEDDITPANSGYNSAFFIPGKR